MPKGRREVPPTAGLALVPRDFVAAGASLERGVAAFVEQTWAQVECSGTAALVVALATLKRLSGRRSVVVPAYTCPLVALAVIRCGLRPVLCDTRPGHFDLCPRALAAACGEDTLAVLVTHLGGRVADFTMASAIARDAGAAVIEDAAQSLGARWRGRPVGGLGDIGVYSLGVGKGLTVYSGGVLVAQDAALRPELRKTAAEMAPYRLDWELRRMVELAGYGLLYRPRGLWLAYGLPLRRKLRAGKLIEAAGDDCCAEIPLHRVGAWRKRIGANALKRLPGFLAAGSARAAPRRSRLEAIDGVSVLGDTEGDAGVWPFLQVLLPTQQARDEALRRLWPAGLGVGRLFIHALADYAYLEPHLDGSGIPNARDFAARMLTVTNSEWLDEDDFEQVCRALEESIH
ncbi:MAG TPA: DegT/DnrJ/EryC1/StrS family aminotransferase [Phenylobacterium sp.]|uniref:DegT/DnrJ/EryC1/StrS family aminotransferase n=1 Tax=Phenylobacterium sp. TaxID=1871053 RepID=UPI002B461942|nr:DegT/DnrJ/EryC1/StrS family aminotransferase [Phenylobacterium sp.]HKR89788.1 DegT/DnrJ/EryC1/StrS family aminotransferase [Phenylobacterium sp.]HKT53579.1 DegT/DnrJ/EryC1/StrS family aminotransferase [Caulobacteraceae bacterium]